MASTYRTSSLLAGFGVILASACDGGSIDEAAAGASGAGATGSTSTSMTTGTTSTSTGGIDTNTDCQSAAVLTVGAEEATGAELDPVEDDEDFFLFTGIQGQPLLLIGDSKPDDNGFSVAYPDLVFTLFDATGQAQIAQTDDAIPRTTQDAFLFTVLPADGDYCLRVTDFCRWAALNLPKDLQCPAGNPVAGIFGFTVRAVALDPRRDAYYVEHDETNEPAEMKYETLPMSAPYFPTRGAVAQGRFDSDVDEDVFRFRVPTDLACNPMGELCTDLVAQGDERVTAHFWMHPGGRGGKNAWDYYGDGATTSIGKAWITAADEPLTTIAEFAAPTKSFDPIFARLQVPVVSGTDYELHVQMAAGAAPGELPFYFVSHHAGGSYPLEKESAQGDNDTISGAQDMLVNINGPENPYAVAGTIAGDTDVDVYRYDNVPISSQYSTNATCLAHGIGSGLRGLRLRILGTDGGVLGVGSVETADAPTLALHVPVPPETTKLFLEVRTTKPREPTIVGEYYQCTVGFQGE